MLRIILFKIKPPLNKKLTLSITICAMVIFSLIITYFNIRGTRELKEMHFNGVIEKIEYCQKGYPYVFVNQKPYYLSGSWGFNTNKALIVGDSIFKNSGESIIKIYHNKTHEYEIFTFD